MKMTVRSKEWKANNLDQYNKLRRKSAPKWRKKNREKMMLYQARRRAKVRNIDCTITLENIIIPSHCPVLKTPLSFEGRRDTTPVLDLIDVSKGYILGNVQVISNRVNRCKSDLTIAEIKLVSNAFRRWAS